MARLPRHGSRRAGGAALTLRPGSEVAGVEPQRTAEEYGERTDNEPEAPPRPLDHALLGHAMPHAGAEDAVGVLDEGKVSALDDVLLELLAVVECHFLRVLEEARVREAQFAFEGRFVRGVLAERRGDCADWRERWPGVERRGGDKGGMETHAPELTAGRGL